MSIGRIALRFLLCEAIRNRTLAGDYVKSSMIASLTTDETGSLKMKADHPWVAVYTDASEYQGQVYPAYVVSDIGQTDLVIEWGISSTMTEKDPVDGRSVVVTGIPDTDENYEFLLDIVGQQIVAAISDPQNEYAQLVAKLLVKVSGTKRSRVASDENGVRLAAHQLVYTIQPMTEPEVGRDLPEPYPRIFELMRSTGGDWEEKADLMLQVLDGSSRDTDAFKRLRLMHEESMSALGLKESAP